MPMVSMTVNGRAVSAEVEGRTLLVQFLRERAQLTGTHEGCDTTQCGCCTVHLNGKGVKSCTVLASACAGAAVTTIEGLAQNGKLHPMQEAFREHHGLQCGFCTPGMIMTAVDMVNRLGHDLAPRTIREQLDGNLCRCTGYHNIVKAIQAGAAAMAGPGRPARQPESEGHAFPPAKSTRIGEPVRRREDLRLITGNGRFSDDVNLPGQACMAVVRSTHAHARLTAIDTRSALASPGVLAVLTGQDLLADGLKPFPHKPFTAHPADIKLENTDGTPLYSAPQYALAIGRVRHVGEAIAIVIAETVAAARDGAELVDVEYESLPAVTDTRAAAQPDAPRVWDDARSNVAVDAQVGNDRDATATAFARAAHVVRFETWIQRVTGVPMEPRAIVSEFDPETGRYTVHAGSGGAPRFKEDVAIMLDVEAKNVRVVMHDVGGNFGTRGFIYPEFCLAPWAARRVGRPVKWTCTRSEAFLSDYQGRDLAVEAELALDAEGTFLAMRGSNIGNAGAHTANFSPVRKGVEIMSSIYRMPAAWFRARATLSNTMMTRPYRSSGRPEVMYVMERLIDLAARECGFDRIELRRRNLLTQAELPYTNPWGMIYDSGDYHGVMEKALALGDWQGFPARRAEARARGRCRGIGVANYVDTASGVPRERGEVTVQPDGRVDFVVGIVSNGQGHETSFAQLMNEWLGVPMDSVRIIAGDTDIVKIGGGTHGGRGLRMASIVMWNSVKQIIEKGKRLAALMLDCEPSEIGFKDGRFILESKGRSVGIFEVAGAGARLPDLPEDLRGPLTAFSDETVNTAAFPYGCHVCEVEIDPELGAVEIVRYAAVDDCGRAVNPLIVDGQIHGGIAQGVGQALLERCHYDPGTGQLLSGSFMDYAMPRAELFPSFITAISEVPSPIHPLGMRPAGEGGTTPALGVMINAVVDALSEFGVRHVEMPATPQRIWQAIRQAKLATESHGNTRT
ncbi:MAG TPA: molybdopterin-dependent oxidoreductase [Burkholderiales bacterium]|nr:molybdopterin-dependent oxidoreductase [Burkholderiales bacterium]